MRKKVVAASLLAATLFVLEMHAAAQKTRMDKSQGQNVPAASNGDTARGVTADQCQRMMDTMEQITGYQGQIDVTMSKLKQNIADLQKANDAPQLQPKIVAQGALLDVMQIYMTQESNAAQSMAHQLRDVCTAAENSGKGAQKKD